MSTEENMTAEERGEARVARKRRMIADIEREMPLRRPILGELLDAIPYNSPPTPLIGLTSTELSQRLEAAPAEVESQLKFSLEDGTVMQGERASGEVEYYISTWGVHERNQHRAYGHPEPPPPPLTAEQNMAFLETALRLVLRMKDDPEYCGQVPERLQLVLEQAERIGHKEVAETVRLELSAYQTAA